LAVSRTVELKSEVSSTTTSGNEETIVKVLKDVGKDEEYLRELLIDFLYRLYYKVLNVNSRERKVIVVESILAPYLFRRVLNEVLLKHFQAISVTFISSHLASLFTLGATTGLVIDCGYTDCQLMPICESFPIVGLCDFVTLGAKRIHAELKSLLIEMADVTLPNGRRTKLKENIDVVRMHLNEETLEEIKLKCCFVTSFDRSRRELKADTKFAPDCDFILNDVTLHVPGYVREMTTEILFVDRVDSSQTIPNLILDCLVKAPLDIKKQLSENIVLIGGTCLLNGFKHRLVSELNDLIRKNSSLFLNKNMRFRFHQPPAIDNYTAWLGAAIFGTMDVTLEPLNI
jgi:actin-related protein 10